MQVISLSDLLREAGEERTKEILSCFCVSLNHDVEHFIQSLAVPYEKSSNARTFLFMDDSLKPLGFVSLSLTSLALPAGISESLKKKLRGFGRSSSENIPCYLIGQLARFDTTEKRELSGNEMFSIIADTIDRAYRLFGGRVVSIDCTDELVHYYEKHGFTVLNKIDNLNQMVYLIRDIRNDMHLKN